MSLLSKKAPTPLERVTPSFDALEDGRLRERALKLALELAELQSVNIPIEADKVVDAAQKFYDFLGLGLR